MAAKSTHTPPIPYSLLIKKNYFTISHLSSPSLLSSLFPQSLLPPLSALPNRRANSCTTPPLPHCTFSPAPPLPLRREGESWHAGWGNMMAWRFLSYNVVILSKIMLHYAFAFYRRQHAKLQF